ncbi:MAG: ribose transporter permease [Firmicutes bacterium]|nr:ribose transporter permease [Bacillota bacterium]
MSSREIGARQISAKAYLRRLGAFTGLILLCAGLAFATPVFLTVNNLLNVLRQVSVISLIGLGETFVILSGGIDLSVGSMLGLTGIVTALTARSGAGFATAALTGVLAAGLMGLVNGLVHTLGRLPSFITTLGTMAVARGLAYVLSKGVPISGFPGGFKVLGQGYFLGIPVPVIVVLIMALICSFVLTGTVFGRYVYAIGSNERAVKLTGIRVNLYKNLIFVASGLLTGVAALIALGRLQSAHPTSGSGYELNAIAAVVIGGASLSGGEGGPWGTILGALIMGVIENGLTLLNVNAFWQQVVIGSVIILAVLVDRLSRAERTDAIVK